MPEYRTEIKTNTLPDEKTIQLCIRTNDRGGIETISMDITTNAREKEERIKHMGSTASVHKMEAFISLTANKDAMGIEMSLYKRWDISPEVQAMEDHDWDDTNTLYDRGIDGEH
jgi:hypothetical protein